MMYVSWKDSETEKECWVWWSVGDPFPRITGRVATFQADGDELVELVRGLEGDYPHPIPGERDEGGSQLPGGIIDAWMDEIGNAIRYGLGRNIDLHISSIERLCGILTVMLADARLEKACQENPVRLQNRK